MLVIGGGNAAICAAITAAEGGASVQVIEAAPHVYRGGNSRHTRDIRYMHPGATRYVTGPYPEDEFWDDLWRVTGGETDEVLARLVIQRSIDIEAWMMAHGVRWQPPLHGTLHLARTNVFMLGGGKAMLNALYLTAEKLGVRIAYDARATTSVDDRQRRLKPRACASTTASWTCAPARWSWRPAALKPTCRGSNSYWGDAADNFIIRGTPYNQGAMLAALLECGALAIGDPKEFHAVALDARAPKFDGGIVTRLDSVPFGIVVNNRTQRFYDEGEDFWPKRYAIWGGLIARQPDQIAYSIVDARSMGLFMPSVFPANQSTVHSRSGRRARTRRQRPVARGRRLQRRHSTRHVRSGGARRLPHRRPHATQESLGGGDRDTAVLRLSAEDRGDVHLSRRRRRPAGARHSPGPRSRAQRVRGR